MAKMYTERHLHTEEQIVVISPNEQSNGIILRIKEMEGPLINTGMLYLTYDEAISSARELQDFVDKQQLNGTGLKSFPKAV